MKLLADAMRENAALKDLPAKNGDAHREARGCVGRNLLPPSLLRRTMSPYDTRLSPAAASNCGRAGSRQGGAHLERDAHASSKRPSFRSGSW
jgi:hypothetical protein